MTRMLSIVAAAFSLFLASCQDVPAPPASSKPSFSTESAYEFNVATVDVVEDYVSPFKAPNVEHLFPTPPAEAVKIWAHDRLRATGRENRMEVIVHNASVVETTLPKTKGIKGMFTVDQGSKYDAKLEVEVKIYGTNKLLPEASANVTATLSRTLAEDATLADREKLYIQMTSELMKLFDKEMDNQIRAYLSVFLAH